MSTYIKAAIKKCVGCHTCELACAIAHSGGDGIEELVLSGEKPGYRLQVKSSRSGRPVPQTCRQCEDAACIEACPTGAIKRLASGKPVLVNEEECDKCGACVEACPFGMMALAPETGTAMKCDLCITRLAKHLEPACVASCPTGALSLSDDESESKSKAQPAAGSAGGRAGR